MPGAGEFPVRKLPSRVISIDKPAPDVAILKLQLPANDPLQYRAGQYVEFILRDGARRSYSMASCAAPAGRQALDRTPPAPPAGRQVHRPRVRGDEGERHPARRGAVRLLLPARRLGQADGPARLGHRLRADQGDRRAADLEEASQRHAVLYWGCRSKADLYMNDWAEAATRQLPSAPLRSRCCPSRSRKTAGPAAPGWSTRPSCTTCPGPDGAPGVCLRRADHGRIGAARFRGALRPAGRRVLCRFAFTSEADKHGPAA